MEALKFLAENASVALWVLGQIVTAAAIYGGIRADIKNLHYRVDHAQKAADEVRSRLDSHIDRRLSER